MTVVVPHALLTDRGVVAVSGPDAEKLLQGLLTNDVTGLLPGAAVFAGLLSPQGKILMDFVAVRTKEGFLIDVPRDKASELVKRLTLYRLRSKVEIADCSADLVVAAAWANGASRDGSANDVAFRDPRLPELGSRAIAAASDSHAQSGKEASEKAYHAHRIALGVPDGGRDYTYGDTFPHEALYDQLHGVSFAKGCYVGQEIVSRMQHRGTVRKRVVQVEAPRDLPAPGTEVKAGDVVIGTLGSTAGARGLALIRLDRAAEFKAKGVQLTVADVPITLVKPAFATFALDPQPAAASKP